jgi:radical SAM superfamily enzyme YgiQ (UPF0313 family)
MHLDPDEECDVVGISCMTSNSYRGYRIADSFRGKGKIVIMGGVHPSLLPDEALEHADAVVVGEAEGVWEQILEDIEADKLQRIYHEPAPDLNRYIPKDFSTLPPKRFFNLVPLQTTRGCPYKCDFCCVADIYGKKIKHIPVQNVVLDIKASGARNYIFLDDNIVADRKYARELFHALVPLKINCKGYGVHGTGQKKRVQGFVCRGGKYRGEQHPEVQQAEKPGGDHAEYKENTENGYSHTGICNFWFR